MECDIQGNSLLPTRTSAVAFDANNAAASAVHGVVPESPPIFRLSDVYRFELVKMNYDL